MDLFCLNKTNPDQYEYYKEPEPKGPEEQEGPENPEKLEEPVKP